MTAKGLSVYVAYCLFACILQANKQYAAQTEISAVGAYYLRRNMQMSLAIQKSLVTTL